MAGVESSNVVYLSDATRRDPASVVASRTELLGYVESMAGSLAVMATVANLTDIARHLVEAQAAARVAMLAPAGPCPPPPATTGRSA